MKRLMAFALVLISIIANGQTYLTEEFMPMKDGQVLYSEVVPVEGITKSELFVRANRWLANTYRSSKDVVQLSDKETGSLIAKGTLSQPLRLNALSTWSCYIDHSITLDVKDGRYRYVFTDVVIRPIAPPGAYGMRSRYNVEEFLHRPMMKRNSEKYITDLDLSIKAMIGDMKKAMAIKAEDF